MGKITVKGDGTIVTVYKFGFLPLVRQSLRINVQAGSTVKARN